MHAVRVCRVPACPAGGPACPAGGPAGPAGPAASGSRGGVCQDHVATLFRAGPAGPAGPAARVW
jgi:hypothetical protein